MKIREKLLALLLSATVVISMLPASLSQVIADEVEPTETSVTETEETESTEEISATDETTATEETPAEVTTVEETTDLTTAETNPTAVKGTIVNSFEISSSSGIVNKYDVLANDNGSRTLGFNFKGAGTGTYDYVSVAIQDSTRKEYFYQRLSNGVAEGYVTVTTPHLPATGTYYICFFAEHLSSESDPHPDLTYNVLRGSFEYTYIEAQIIGSHSITLDGGKIGLNFYVDKMNEDLSNIKIVFSQEGKSDVTFNMADATTANYGSQRVYKAQYFVNAKEMTDVITAKLYVNDKLVDEDQYSVRDYYDVMNTYNNGRPNSDIKFANLLNSLMLYGGYAQKHFNYHTDNLASAGISATLSSVPENSVYATSTSGALPTGVTVDGVSVLLKSTNSTRLYFTIPSGSSISDYQLSINGSKVNPVKYSDNTYYITEEGIQIHKLSELSTFTISDGSNTWTLKYCPMSYAYAMQDNSDIGNVCKAMYRLNASAIAYVSRTGTYNDDFAYQVLALVNALREEKGREPLQWSDELARAGSVRASEIALQFTHERLDGSECGTTSSDVKGENIAAGQATPEAVVNSWINSPGHYANLINPNYRTMGVGCYQESGTTYRIYWAQEFGY